MPKPPFVEFAPDPALEDAFRECTENFDVGDPEEEWPHNILSTKLVIYGSGRMARADEPIEHLVDPDELDLIRRLAHDAGKVMTGVKVGMGSELSHPFHEFHSAANIDEKVPEKIDASLIRARFGGTIFPLATITVEPFAESGVWWAEVLDQCAGQSRDLLPWRNLIQWFNTQPEFVDKAFVRIGEFRSLNNIEDDDLPPGTTAPGCVLPRLALGRTKAGSLAGLCGYVVQR